MDCSVKSKNYSTDHIFEWAGNLEFYFPAGIFFWDFLLDHTTVVTQELITLCTFSGPNPDAHTSHFNILILSN